MKYLLQITRSTRAERPAESDILSDSLKYEQNDYDGMAQDPTADSFFIIDCPNRTQLSLDLIKILSMQNFSPYALSDGDGYLVIDYPMSETWTGGLRDGSEAKLAVYLEDAYSEETTYSSYSEAQDAINLLNPSDGYILFDVHPTERTYIISSRPVLWVSSSGVITDTAIKKASSHTSRAGDRLIDRV